MNSAAPSFDRIWERTYERGQQLNKYPYDGVVAFVFRHRPRDRTPREVRILEIGFGAGNNLWFCAREGFTVAGVDASQSAVSYAKDRFSRDGLSGDLRLADFTSLPFEDASFDLAINRAATTQTGFSAAHTAIAEVRRVLRPGGLIYSEIYSDRSSSRGRPGPDGVLLDVEGPLAGAGQVCFYSRRDIENLFSAGWTLESLVHVEAEEELRPPFETLAYFGVIARKS